MLNNPPRVSRRCFITRQADLVFSVHICACCCLPKTHIHSCMHTDGAHEHINPRVHVRLFMCERMEVLEAGGSPSIRPRGGCSLQLSLQLPTGCEGHWCDSANYRGRKPALQTFTAAAQLGSAGLNPSSPQPLYTCHPSRVDWGDIIHTERSGKKHGFHLQDAAKQKLESSQTL